MEDILENKELVCTIYPEMNMTKKRQKLSFTTRKSNTNENDGTGVFSGDLIFSWPQIWIEDLEMWEGLADRLAHDATKRFQLRRRNFNAKIISSDLVHFPLFSTPLAWREEALTSESSDGYKKLVLWITYCTAFYLIDDITENWRKEKEHAGLVRSLARLLYQIGFTRFESTDEIRENVDFKFSTKGNQKLGDFLMVVFDVVNDVKAFLEATTLLLSPSMNIFGQSMGTEATGRDDAMPSPFLHLARTLRNGFELQTWDGCEGYSQFLNKDLFHELRSWVVGFDLCYEFLILLDGLVVPEKVRNNFYWNKIHRNTRKLGYMINDTFSLQKELLEMESSGKRVDNGVLISKEVDNLSLEEALKKYLESLNELLQDYRKECKFALENEAIKFDLSEEEKIIFNISLKALPLPIAALVQTQLKMPRYMNENVQYVFTQLESFND